MKRKIFGKLFGMIAAAMMAVSCGVSSAVQNITVGELDEAGTVLHVTLPEKSGTNNAEKLVQRIATGLDFQISFLEETDEGKIVAKNHQPFAIETNLVEGKAFIEEGYEGFADAVKPVLIDVADKLNYKGIYDYVGSYYYGSLYKDANGSEVVSDMLKAYEKAYDTETWTLREGYKIHTSGRILKVDLDLAAVAQVPGCADILKYDFRVAASGNAYASLVPAEDYWIDLHFNAETGMFEKLAEKEFVIPETSESEEESLSVSLESEETISAEDVSIEESSVESAEEIPSESLESEESLSSEEEVSVEESSVESTEEIIA